VRVAKGKQLPQEWQPGQPLNVGSVAQPRASESSACPFGPRCFRCAKGERWDATRGKHDGRRNDPEAKPRASRLKRGRRSR